MTPELMKELFWELVKEYCEWSEVNCADELFDKVFKRLEQFKEIVTDKKIDNDLQKRYNQLLLGIEKLSTYIPDSYEDSTHQYSISYQDEMYCLWDSHGECLEAADTFIDLILKFGRKS